MTAPKQVLTNALDLYVNEYLAGLGFSFSPSGLKYTRSENGFRQEIGFQGSKNNTAGSIIDFKPMFVIYSAAYKKWHTTTFPGMAVLGGGYIGGDRAPLKPYDNSFQEGFGYDFVRQDHERIVLDLLRNIQQAALPFFEANNSWKKIADGANVQERERVDALILAGRPEEALALCSAALERLEATYRETGNANYQQPIAYMKARNQFLQNQST
ncbi:MAG: hypothetical protein EOO11_13195 [Chitinophagaceae bacterium]|nr:MAG: hypothetical protein EOO11_13195 [Chitinophagaceae bacterium]